MGYLHFQGLHRKTVYLNTIFKNTSWLDISQQGVRVKFDMILDLYYTNCFKTFNLFEHWMKINK